MHLSFREGGGVINMSYDAVSFYLPLYRLYMIQSGR